MPVAGGLGLGAEPEAPEGHLVASTRPQAIRYFRSTAYWRIRFRNS